MTTPQHENAPEPAGTNAPNISHDSNEIARFQAEDELVQSELRAESLLSEMFEDMGESL